MLSNYLKLALRTMQRQRGYTVINVTGLAVGLACCLLILLFVRDELSYDRFFPGADRIYRVVHEEHGEDGTTYSARSPVPLGPTLRAELPEAEAVVRFWRSFRAVLEVGDQAFRTPGLYFTDPSVGDVFALDFQRGDPATALNAPHTIVLTASMAQRLFGTDDAVGHVVDYDGYPGGDSLQFTVTGVLRDLPANTHLAFSALASLTGIETERDNFGSYKPLWTYVRLPAQVTPASVEPKLADFADRYLNRSETSKKVLHLEPITTIHLESRYEGGFQPGGDVAYLSLFAVVGVFILLIACINFVNLATARSMSRAREVGMRKVLGAVRRQLVGQFLGEAMLLSGVALLLALVLVELLLPAFNGLFGTALRADALRSGSLLPGLIGLAAAVGLLAGAYPAFFLSGFRPGRALTGRTGPRGATLRKILVVFQFAVSVVLIVGTLVVYRQLDYLRSTNLGFDRDQVVVLPYSPNEEPLLAALRQHPNVLGASVSQRVPVSTINADGRPVLPEGFDAPVGVESYIIDDAFLDTYEIPLVAGRNLSHELASDTAAFLINETAVRRFGWGTPQEALGRTLTWTNGPTEGPVVGVVRDFHLQSMHEAIEPLVMHRRPGERWWRTFISVKLRPQDVDETLAFLASTWRTMTPGGAYDYFFIDDSFEQLHRADARFGRIFGTFAGLAILIACLGLFGLAAFTAEQRTREIGVRKVLGASVGSIVLLLSGTFTRLVGVAFVVAVPIAYLAMNRWLGSFAYRIDMSGWTFLGAGLVALGVALLTVGYQAVRAALADPVKSLRYE